MTEEYISREAAIAYIREQSEECQKAFEELGGENGIYADAYNDLAEDFYSIPAADVAEVVRSKDCDAWKRNVGIADSPNGHCFEHDIDTNGQDFCSYGEKKGETPE